MGDQISLERGNRRYFESGLWVGEVRTIVIRLWGVGGESTERDYWKEGAFQVQIKSWYKEIPQKSTGIPQLRLPARVDM